MKTLAISLWIVRIIVALGFLAASTGKVTMNPAVLDMFAKWGYPAWFCLSIGILEAAGAILMLIPKFSKYAALGLLAIMAGATVTHLLNDPPLQVLRPLIFAALLTLTMVLGKQYDRKKSDQEASSS